MRAGEKIKFEKLVKDQFLSKKEVVQRSLFIVNGGYFVQKIDFITVPTNSTGKEEIVKHSQEIEFQIICFCKGYVDLLQKFSETVSGNKF